VIVYVLKMRGDKDATEAEAAAWSSLPLPRPTPQFRRRAWLAFQRALNPLAPPKQLRTHRQR
jgi:hypothetical protein